MHKVAILPGDGIGPDIIKEAVKVLNAVAEKYNHKFQFKEGLIGGAAIDTEGTPLPSETLELCLNCDAVLLGAVGGPKWDNVDPEGVRPEQGLLGLRKNLELYTNLRPVKIYDALIDSSTVKKEVIEGVDILVARELTGGIYFGERAREDDRAFDTMDYRAFEIERIIRKACQLAINRRRIVHSVDKANVLESSRLWREIATNISKEFPEIEFNHILVDNCAMQIIKRPKQFDVMVMGNMFGDILTDEASMLSGSLGMLSSASLGEKGRGMYEPAHGSAPKYTGQDIVNPIATILSGALMLRYSLGMENEARAIEQAVDDVLNDGYRTKDIMQEGKEQIGTKKMGELIANKVLSN